jgi:hypothetical protein
MVLILLVYSIPTSGAGFSLYAILWGLTPVTLHQMPFVVGASALAWVVGYLSFLTPSGLGVREGVLTILLAQVYPLPVAIVGSLLYRLVLTLGEVLAVLIAWGHERLATAIQPASGEAEHQP